MSKRLNIFSRSFVVGILTAAVCLITLSWIFLLPETVISPGHVGVNSFKPLLTEHPLLVLAIILIVSVITGIIDYYYRSLGLKKASVASSLVALILSTIIFALILNYQDLIIPPTQLSAEDVTEIQRQRFGKAGEFLKNADRITLYSTESIPHQGKNDEQTPELFHGYKVLGSIDYENPEQIQAIWSDLQKHIYYGDGQIIAMCYNPRHGIRAYQGELITDYHICFECNRLYIYANPASQNEEFINLDHHSVSGFLNQLLDAAGIEREKPYCE